MVEIDNEMPRLKAWSKIIFVLMIIIMPFAAWDKYSGWWMIGYVAIIFGSLQGLLGAKLPLEYGVGLMLADIALIITTFIGIWSDSIWLPIIQITVGVMAGGCLHNLLEEQQKVNTPEPSSIHKKGIAPANDFYENDCMGIQRLKKQISLAANNYDVGKVLDLCRDPENQKYFIPLNEQLDKDCKRGDAEALYIYGFIFFVNAQVEGNANHVRDAISSLGPAVAYIAKAAQKEYRPAMMFIANNYRKYHFGNFGRTEKECFKAIVDLASEYCSPEYCAQQCDF